MIRLDQIEKEKKDEDAADARESSPSARAAAREKSPQVQEAVAILADLVALEQGSASVAGKTLRPAQAQN